LKVEQADEGEGRTYEILGLIDQLFQMRLVDKLSRPISFEAKEVVFQNYKQKFMLLHQLLERTRKEVPRENESTQSKNKSFNSNVGIKQKTQKQDIKKIEARYNEVAHSPPRSSSRAASSSTTRSHASTPSPPTSSPSTSRSGPTSVSRRTRRRAAADKMIIYPLSGIPPIGQAS
jgi:hypothetical protein